VFPLNSSLKGELGEERMAESAGTKKHEPTAQKLKRARQEGQVAKSVVFTQLFQMVGVLLGIVASYQLFWSTPEMVLHYTVFSLSQGIGEWLLFWRDTVWKSVLLIVGGGALGSVFGEFFQVGLLVSAKPLRLDPNRCNPTQGVKKVGKELKNIWLLLLKFTGAAIVAFLVIMNSIDRVPQWWGASPLYLGEEIVALLLTFAGYVIAYWIALGLLERLYRKFEFLKEQKMTDEEMKKEMKDSEGDPHLRSHRKALQREMAFTEVSQRVKRARVIVVKRKS
jgi:flagellar biosynthesis protein FlhB